MTDEVREEILMVGRLRDQRDKFPRTRQGLQVGQVVVSHDRLYVVGEKGEYLRLKHITPAVLRDLKAENEINKAFD